MDANINFINLIAEELNLKPEQVGAVLKLFDEGCTVPFIARYRKEATGSLDEVLITAVRDKNLKLIELNKRRDAILKSLQERGLLTQELEQNILTAQSLTQLEDLYLPFRPKRRTRALIAIENGLKPLAELIFNQDLDFNPEQAANNFINENIKDVDDALSGACDIIAEQVSEDSDARYAMRKLFARRAILKSTCVKGKESDQEALNYKDYFEYARQAASMPSHQVLAIFRGEREGFLNVTAAPPDDSEAIAILKSRFIKNNSQAARLAALAIEDSYKRLLKSSIETELRNALKKRADLEAIKIFAGNLRELLMAAPLGQKAVLAIDPGIRTGCKVVCLDAQGKLLYHTVIFINNNNLLQAAEIIKELINKYKPEAIAIGNGTAGRETESFIRDLNLENIIVASVNESGASVYSASEAARRELGEYDVTVRGAVSIGRRLIDPMAELVKIEPKSIGVGQYQHDVDQKELKQALDDIVISCVNAVGVNVNTASPEILAYISGLNKNTASQIIKYRDENGAFKSRDELKKVPRLGPKSFEQCAGFLRILNSENVLDASAVHPENYKLVEQMAASLNCSVKDLIKKPELRLKLKANLDKF
ncbi:MAG: helix-hairpin-helix domain-containing protein, partial [Synergistaceae bacterium]|nr:helix-hairpin-helix domain-containing protein [Synergistaceae bacterium]